VQQVHCDVAPEFTKNVGERIAADGAGILLRNSACGTGLAGLIAQRNALADAASPSNSETLKLS